MHKKNSPSLKVVSYNIHKGFGVGNLKFVLSEIRSAIRLINADLVFLQEVCGEEGGKRTSTETPTTAQFEFLADSVWEHFSYGKNATYESGNHGNAILSKFPIVSEENIDISTLQFSQRGILHNVIEIPKEIFGKKSRIHILCVHLGLLETERQAQILKLCDRIQTHIPEHEPIILAGDFNDWRLKADAILYEKLNLQDAYKIKNGKLAKTFPAWFPIFSLDRIYCRHLKIGKVERLTGAPWNRLSDHAALFVEFFL